MPLEVRRFTVSVTPELDRKLDELKRARYWNATQSEMIRDLIALGLLHFESEPEEIKETAAPEVPETQPPE